MSKKKLRREDPLDLGFPNAMLIKGSRPRDFKDWDMEFDNHAPINTQLLELVSICVNDAVEVNHIRLKERGPRAVIYFGEGNPLLTMEIDLRELFYLEDWAHPDRCQYWINFLKRITKWLEKQRIQEAEHLALK